MVARPFRNTSGKTKFQGTFDMNGNPYEYKLYLTPLPDSFPAEEQIEIVEYFGTRRFKKGLCLGLNRGSFKKYLKKGDISAFIIVNPVGIDNYASCTLQNYDWCTNNPDIDMIWINDVCRTSASGLPGHEGEPLKGLFFFIEQLVVQNLGLSYIRLYIDNHKESTLILKNIYEKLGFMHNSEEEKDLCPGFLGGDEIVMEKRGIDKEPVTINFSEINAHNAVNLLAESTTQLKVTDGGFNKKKRKRKTAIKKSLKNRMRKTIRK